MVKILSARFILVSLLSFSVAPSWGGDSGYPNRLITIQCGFSPGSAVDMMARLVGQVLFEELGQRVVVENRPGASGAIAAERVAKAAPDGYTLLLLSGANAALPALRPNLPFDPMSDFTPISLLAIGSFAVSVSADLPVKSLRELIALAKSRPKPNTLRYASAGVGSVGHLMAEQFTRGAHIDMEHIPYKGSSEAVMAAAAGNVDMVFATPLTVVPYMKTGEEKLKLLAISSGQRSTLLPDIPTISESGLPGYDKVGWYGLSGPAGMPQAVVDKLNAALAKGFNSESVRSILASQGLEPSIGTPSAFAEFFANEVKQTGELIKAVGIQP